MKYCVVIIDGASGWPLVERGGKTCLELAHTPNLDAMVREGITGLVRTVPPGMEPDSACACMSVLGYDPEVYYRGRGAIEARSMGITVNDKEAVFRCNLVAIREGRMWSYSSGSISTVEAQVLITALNETLGNDRVRFYPGVGYRHICRLKGQEETLLATCIPPQDIPGKVIDEYLPKGRGSNLLRELMSSSCEVFRDHPVNLERQSSGRVPATMIWLFWGSGKLPDMPDFRHVYGLSVAVTSGVDVVRGLAWMLGMEILDIPGVTDGIDNDYSAQLTGALKALSNHDLVVLHIEASDEAAHSGDIDDKVEVIHRVDQEVINRLRLFQPDGLRVLVMPDHSTPIKIQTHSNEPVPFILWGAGITNNGGEGFSEAEAKRIGLFIDPGYKIMGRLVGKKF